MLYHSKCLGIGLKGGILLTTVVFGLAHEVRAIAPAPETTSPASSSASVAPLILSGRQSDRPPGTYSPGITEIIKMLDAKVDAQVILAYIQNAPIPYNPDATELIALKKHGASTEMLTALLHRGDELRLQLAQAQSAANPPPTASAYNYAPEEAYPASPYPASVEAPYPATDYTYVYGWPWLYWAPACNRYQPYCYAQGRWYAHQGNAQPVGEGGRWNWVSATPLATQAAGSVSTPRSGYLRGSGRLGGGRAGRAR